MSKWNMKKRKCEIRVIARYDGETTLVMKDSYPGSKAPRFTMFVYKGRGPFNPHKRSDLYKKPHERFESDDLNEVTTNIGKLAKLFAEAELYYNFGRQYATQFTFTNITLEVDDELF